MALSNSKSGLSLHESIKTFDLSMVSQAFQHDSSSINTLDPNIGWTVLYKAVVYEQIDIAKFLLEKGADPNLPNKIGETPLHYAAEIGKSEFISLLLKNKANLNIKQSDGNTPLHIACKKNHTSAVKMMMQYHPEVNVQNKLGRTPLHFVSNNNNVEIYELLLKNKASLEIKDKWGREPQKLIQEEKVISKVVEEPLPKKDRIKEPNPPVHSQMSQMREIPNTEKRLPKERVLPKEPVGLQVQKRDIENKENIPRKQPPTQPSSLHRRVEVNKTRVIKKKEEEPKSTLTLAEEISKEMNKTKNDRVLADRTNLIVNHMSSDSDLRSSFVIDNGNEKKESKKIEWRENEEKDMRSSQNIRDRILTLKAKLNEQPPLNSHKKSQSQCLPSPNIDTITSKISEVKKRKESKIIEESLRLKENLTLANLQKANSVPVPSIANEKNILKSDNIRTTENRLPEPKLMRGNLDKASPVPASSTKNEGSKTTIENLEKISPESIVPASPEMKRDFPSKYKALTLSHSKSERFNLTLSKALLDNSSLNQSGEQNLTTPQGSKPLYESFTNKAIASAQNIKHIFTPTSRQSLSASRLFNTSIKNLFKDSSAQKSRFFDEDNIYECIEFTSASNDSMIDWLKSIGLEELKLNFIDTGYSSFSKFRQDYSHCPTIFKDLLCKFGIDKLGHRCRIIMKLREDIGLFFRTGIFKNELNSKNSRFTSPSIQEWLRGLGLEEYNENFIDNGFDNIEYILLQTSFKEMPFDEFLVRDELRIEDDITINTILKRLRQTYQVGSSMHKNGLTPEMFMNVLWNKDDSKNCNIF